MPSIYLVMNRTSKIFIRKFKSAILIALFLSCSFSVVSAKDDLALAKELSAKGKILPLSEILSRAKQHKAGEVIDVEFEQKKRRYVYEIEILEASGQVWEVKLDATTGALIKLELDD
jgi:uncharacterized membrane protein YkoI